MTNTQDTPYQASGFCSECGCPDPWCVDGYTNCCNQPVNDWGGRDGESVENRWGWKDYFGKELSAGDIVLVRGFTGTGPRARLVPVTEGERYVLVSFSAPEAWGITEAELPGWDGRTYWSCLNRDSGLRVELVGHVDIPQAKG